MPGIDFYAFDHLNDSVVITDVRQDPLGPRILHVNRAFTRMTGYGPDEVIGKTPRVLQGPKTNGLVDRLRRLAVSGDELVLETVNYRKDGSELGLEWSVKSIRDDDGRITNLLSIQRDITERLLVQSDLFETKDRLEATLDALAESLVLTDNRGQVTYLNPAASSLIGWTPSQAAGRVLADVVPLTRCLDDQPLRSLAAKALEEQRTIEPRDPCVLTPRRGTPFLVRVTATPIRRAPGLAEGVAVRVSRLEISTAGPGRVAGRPEVRSLLDRGELVRRLRNLVASARELGSVHALGQIELEPREHASSEILENVIAAMSARIRLSDTLAELDERSTEDPTKRIRYGLILHHCPFDKALEVARSLLVTIRSVVADPEDANDPAYRAVIGVVPFSAEARDADELLDNGRLACREAWTLGGDQVQIFRSESGDRARKEHEILRAAELLRAIEHNRLCLFGQEIVPLKPGLPRLIEILLRLPDGNGAFLPPAAFVRAAERYDLAARLDRWVVTSTLAAYHRLFRDDEVALSINLSAKSIGDEGFLDLLRRRLVEYEVPPERICFEITETAAVRGVERASEFIDALRGLGCRFALDDFGDGHASFRYLKALDLDYLKIDRGFVRDVLDQEFDLAIVESFHRIGHVLGIRVVAEGVENREVLDRLRDIGLDYAQGYVHGKPQPLEEFVRGSGSV